MVLVAQLQLVHFCYIEYMCYFHVNSDDGYTVYDVVTAIIHSQLVECHYRDSSSLKGITKHCKAMRARIAGRRSAQLCEQSGY